MLDLEASSTARLEDFRARVEEFALVVDKHAAGTDAHINELVSTAAGAQIQELRARLNGFASIIETHAAQTDRRIKALADMEASSVQQAARLSEAIASQTAQVQNELGVTELSVSEVQACITTMAAKEEEMAENIHALMDHAAMAKSQVEALVARGPAGAVGQSNGGNLSAETQGVVWGHDREQDPWHAAAEAARSTPPSARIPPALFGISDRLAANEPERGARGRDTDAGPGRRNGRQHLARCFHR